MNFAVIVGGVFPSGDGPANVALRSELAAKVVVTDSPALILFDSIHYYVRSAASACWG